LDFSIGVDTEIAGRLTVFGGLNGKAVSGKYKEFIFHRLESAASGILLAIEIWRPGTLPNT
jgi:hypothetical protein